MTFTTWSAEPLTVDGTNLQTYAYAVQSFTGRSGIPELRGEDIALPFGRGDLHNPRGIGPRTETWAMFVIGANADGTTPTAGTDRREQFNANLSALKRLFFGAMGSTIALQRVVRTPTGDQTQTATGIATAMSDPETMAGGTRAVFTVDVKILGGLWETSTATTVTCVAGDNAATNSGDLAAVPSSIVFTGPLVNPKLTVASTGLYVQLSETLAGSGNVVTLSPQTFAVTPTASWATLGRSTSPRSRWFLEVPVGAQTLALTRVGGGAVGAGTVAVTWKDPHL